MWTVGKIFHYATVFENLGFATLAVDPVVNFLRGLVVHIFVAEVTGL